MSVQRPAGCDGHVNQVARSQIPENGSRVISRALEHALNRADAFHVEPVFRLQPTELDESVADVLFLIGSHRYALYNRMFLDDPRRSSESLISVARIWKRDGYIGVQYHHSEDAEN